MFRRFRITTFKSIKKLDIDVGQFNVIIGENGAGKSNFLEALAVFSAGLSNKLDNEFLGSRGIRPINTESMFSIFNQEASTDSSIFAIDPLGGVAVMMDYDKNNPYPEINHNVEYGINNSTEADFYNSKDGDEKLNERISEIYEEIAEKYGSIEIFEKQVDELFEKIENGTISTESPLMADLYNISRYLNIKRYFDSYKNKKDIRDNGGYIIYSPEASKLRVFESESQIQPLGVNGEGILKLLRVMREHEPEKFEKILEMVSMIQWVDRVSLGDKNDASTANKIKIFDRFMKCEIDHRSANEGFLFVLFYGALFSSKFTPTFFAVDNIDASLNPKLCRILIKELAKLAKENGKQAFVTTHNPAILDGLDLHEDEQRLFVVERDDEGATQLRRVEVDDLPKPKRNGETIKLSEAFMRGHLGGLPTNF